MIIQRRHPFWLTLRLISTGSENRAGITEISLPLLSRRSGCWVHLHVIQFHRSILFGYIYIHTQGATPFSLFPTHSLSVIIEIRHVSDAQPNLTASVFHITYNFQLLENAIMATRLYRIGVIDSNRDLTKLKGNTRTYSSNTSLWHQHWQHTHLGFTAIVSKGANKNCVIVYSIQCVYMCVWGWNRLGAGAKGVMVVEGEQPTGICPSV